MNEKKKIVAVVDDLMFLVKIDAAAKQADFDIVFVKTEDQLFESVKETPSLIILDLNISSLPALEIAKKLKSDPETKAITLIAYISHVQTELKQKALETGIDAVLARSAFSSNLPTILKRYSDSH